jgi:hypothetical protein
MPMEYQTSTGLLGVGGHVVVDELVAALFDAGEVGVGVDQVDAIVKELCPVVGGDLVEVCDQFGALVGNDQRAGVAAFAEEDRLEVVERFLVVGELADEGVGVEPEELTLLVVVLSALPVRPRRCAAAQDAGGDGGVFGRAPLAAGFVVEISGGEGEHFAVLLLVLEAGAGGEDVSEVLRHALVDPEQVALLRGGEVGLIQPRRAPILAVPGVGELVGEQVGHAELVGVVGEVLLADTVIGGLAVFEAHAAGGVGKGQEQVVLRVVM